MHLKVRAGRDAIRALFTSFRLRHTDGVSVEAEKLARILGRWGWEVGELAGEFGSALGETSPSQATAPLRASGSPPVSRFVAPSLGIGFAEELRRLGLWDGANRRRCLAAIERQASLALEEIASAMDQFSPDLVIVENVFGLPLNPGYAIALKECLEERELPALLRHHDLIWQRPEYSFDRLDRSLFEKIAPYFPPKLRNGIHVVINRLSENQLRERGFDPVLLHNAFEFPDPKTALSNRDARQAKARASLDIPLDCLLLVQPTRAIERKRVPDSIALGERLSVELGREVVLLVCGPAEDGYDAKLEELARRISSEAGVSEQCSFGLLLGKGKLPIDLAYEASDFVVFPSSWEGFGNPVFESIAWAKPLVVREYPVLSEFLQLGLSFIPWDPDPLEGVLAWMNLDEASRRAVLIENLTIADRWFSLEAQAENVRGILKSFGFAVEASEDDLEAVNR